MAPCCAESLLTRTCSQPLHNSDFVEGESAMSDFGSPSRREAEADTVEMDAEMEMERAEAELASALLRDSPATPHDDRGGTAPCASLSTPPPPLGSSLSHLTHTHGSELSATNLSMTSGSLGSMSSGGSTSSIGVKRKHWETYAETLPMGSPADASPSWRTADRDANPRTSPHRFVCPRRARARYGAGLRSVGAGVASCSTSPGGALAVAPPDGTAVGGVAAALERAALSESESRQRVATAALDEGEGEASAAADAGLGLGTWVDTPLVRAAPLPLARLGHPRCPMPAALCLRHAAGVRVLRVGRRRRRSSSSRSSSRPDECGQRGRGTHGVRRGWAECVAPEPRGGGVRCAPR
jgi:hypothetical protein